MNKMTDIPNTSIRLREKYPPSHRRNPVSITLSLAEFYPSIRTLKISAMTEKIKDIIGIVKEAALIMLFLTFFIFPSAVSNRLQEAGFYQGSFMGMDWKSKMEKAEASTQMSLKNGHSVSLIQENMQHLDSLVASLQNSDSFKSNPALKTIAKQLKISTDSVNSVDARIKTNLISQQDFISSVSDKKAPDAGWIFLGKAKIAGDEWQPGNPKTIDSIKPRELQDKILTIKEDVYLRSAAKPTASALDVVSKNEKVRATEILFNPNKTGKSVWAKVERLK